MNARAKEILAVWFTAAIMCLLLAFVANDAWSAPAAPTVAEWERLNDICIGSQVPPDHNQACKDRERVAGALMRDGYVLENHDVWVTQVQVRTFGNIMRYYEGQARAAPGEAASLMPVLVQTVARAMPLPQVFAIWNDPDVREVFRDTTPMAWAMMSEGMRQVAMYHAKENDPRFMLDY